MAFTLILLRFCLVYPYVVDAKLTQHTLNLTWGIGAPDGNAREMVLTNGGYPGPQLIFDEGDQVEVTVHNNLPYNTTVHWHGLEQHDTPWSDGVPGLSQTYIKPDTTFIYRFTAAPAGTFWYHSHSRGLLQDGQIGAIFIRRSNATASPFSMISNKTSDIDKMERAARDPKILLLSDWTNFTSTIYHNAEIATNMDLFCVDSVLINGKGAINCQTQDFLNRMIGPALSGLLNGTKPTDKGCMVPNLEPVQGDYYKNADLSKLPPGLNSGCKATKGDMEVIQVDAKDAWVSLNFIGAQTLKGLIVSLDGHPMWVYEADGGYVEPRLTEVLNVYHGARYAVMIKLDQKPGNYTLRLSVNNPDQILSGFGTMQYKGGSDISPPAQYLNYGGLPTSKSVLTIDRDALTPYSIPPPAPTADSIHFTSLNRMDNAWKWTANGHTQFTSGYFDAEVPLLYNPNSLAGLNENLVFRTLNGSWVDIVLQTIWDEQTPTQPPHPIHKHSSKAYIIGQGDGIFNWSSTAEAIEEVPHLFNLVNPDFRDTFVTSPVTQGWIVIRYQVVTPGAFLLHCHIEPHLDSGMALAILDGVDKWPQIPDGVHV